MNGKRGTEIGKEYRKQDEKANSAPPVALAVCGVDAMGGRRFPLSERADRIPSHRMREGAQKIVCGCRSRRTQRGKQALKTEKTNAVRFSDCVCFCVKVILSAVTQSSVFRRFSVQGGVSKPYRKIDAKGTEEEKLPIPYPLFLRGRLGRMRTPRSQSTKAQRAKSMVRAQKNGSFDPFFSC